MFDPSYTEEQQQLIDTVRKFVADKIIPNAGEWDEHQTFPVDTFEAGLWPFIPGDLAKLVAAALVVPAGWSVVRQVRGDEPNR